MEKSDFLRKFGSFGYILIEDNKDNADKFISENTEKTIKSLLESIFLSYLYSSEDTEDIKYW